jgi:ferritin-like metal-binding protein YciE
MGTHEQTSPRERTIASLKDAHAMEEQALVQMRLAPRLAGVGSIASAFQQHLRETEEHEQLIRQRLQECGERPSRIKDTAMKAGGLGFALFAGVQPDTPGKLAAHAYSYEHLEAGAYELLGRIAALAEDQASAELAGRILEQERAMAGRLESHLDEAAEASLKAVKTSEPNRQLDKYLADAHAIEMQATQLLEKAQKKMAGEQTLADIYGAHLAETRAHAERVERRLCERGASPSALKDTAMKLGAINWGAFFAAQPDTPAKLAAFAYAFEHLEIAGYEQLRRVAERAGDGETVAMASAILGEERAAAGKIEGAFDLAARAVLDPQAARAA